MDEIFSFNDLVNDFNSKRFSGDLIIKSDFMNLRLEDLNCIESDNQLGIVKNNLSSIEFSIPEELYFCVDKDNFYVYTFDIENITFSFVLQECTL